MVALIELRSGHYHWTGKSYPTTGQEDGLVRFQDLGSHFINTSGGKVMLLGCHDLNIFNPRGTVVTKQEWRKKIRKNFYQLSNDEKPDVVLHHPHTTDSKRIWTAAWNELMKSVPSVEMYLSAGRYFNDGEPERTRDINEVRQKTKLGQTVDFVVWISGK
jgi:hypothetical protein